MIPTIRVAVFTLARPIAATAVPWFPITIFIESTTISRITITTATIVLIFPLQANIINTEFVNNLSLIASIILPKSVTRLYFLAT